MLPEIKIETLVIISTILLVPSFTFSKGLCSIKSKLVARKLNKTESLILVPFTFLYVYITSKILIYLALYFNVRPILSFYYRIIYEVSIAYGLKLSALTNELLLGAGCSNQSFSVHLVVFFILYFLQFILAPYFFGKTMREYSEDDWRSVKRVRIIIKQVIELIDYIINKITENNEPLITFFNLLKIPLFFFVRVFFSIVYIKSLVRVPYYSFYWLIDKLKFLPNAESFVEFFTANDVPVFFEWMKEKANRYNYRFVIDINVSDNKLISGELRNFEFNSDKSVQMVILEKVFRWERRKVETISAPHFITNKTIKEDSFLPVTPRRIPGDQFVITQLTAREINITKYPKSLLLVFEASSISEVKKSAIDVVFKIIDFYFDKGKFIYSSLLIYYPRGLDEFLVEFVKKINNSYEVVGALKLIDYSDIKLVKILKNLGGEGEQHTFSIDLMSEKIEKEGLEESPDIDNIFSHFEEKINEMKQKIRK